MASISNLAVIISGHTKPLEDAMKKAQSKVGHFGKSFKEGLGLGAGVMGLDKLEQAMKKALGDFPGLAEAAEAAEKAFGGMLLKVTGMSWLLPKVADFLEFWAEKITGVTREMKEQQKIQERTLEFQKELRDARVDDIKALNDSLDAQLDAIDPLREQLRIVEKLKQQQDANFNPIALQEAKRKFEIVAANKTAEKVKEIEASLAKWNEQLDEAEGNFGEMLGKLMEYQESFGPITKAQADMEKMNDLIAESRRLIDSQIPAVQKLADMYARSREAFLAGNMTEEEYQAVINEYGKALAEQNKAQKVQLAGAATGADAYSTIINGIVNQTTEDTPQKQLQTQMSIDKELKKQTEYQKKMANGQGYISFRVLQLGGAG